MSVKYIVSLDQGTTSSRAILFDHSGRMTGMAQKEFKQFYPRPGWVEHDPEEIWSSQCQVLSELLASQNVQKKDVAGIGITNQRETTVVWEKKTGKAIYPAIVWQDRRTADYCDQLKKQGWGPTVNQKTGLVLDAYFSATKIKWILDQVPGAKELAANGELAFGTIDTWLIWKLTDGKLHITDLSNASRTMLFNIHTCQWDQEMLTLFDIPRNILPEPRSSSEVYGLCSNLIPAIAAIPISGIAGDQQAALFGQLCTKPGMVKNTYGTGCFMLMNTGQDAFISKNNLLTTIAWKIGNRVEYALEGSIFMGGAVVQWLRDGLHFIKSSAEVEQLAAQVKDTQEVYIVPAFAGLGAPHWNGYARGSIFGMTGGITSAHLARAALESIAYQTQDVLKAMESDTGIRIQELRVDGGATVNNILLQFQTDILQVPVVRPAFQESTARGAAYLAGLAVGFWKSMADLEQDHDTDRIFSPAMDLKQRETLLKGWQRAVKATIAWAEDRE